MTAVAPPTYVDVEGLTPSRWGLLDAAALSPRWDDRMRNGVEWQPICGGGVTRDLNTCAEFAERDVIEDGAPVTWSGPVTVYKAVSCRTVGVTPEELVTRATGGLALGESAALETAVWGPETGDDSLRFWNATDTTILAAGAAVSLTKGLGLLEEALYPYGEGIIHAPRRVAAWASKGLIRWDQRPVTYFGNRWSFGAYPGTDVEGDAAAADTTWLIGTPRVNVWRGPVRILGGDQAAWLDRSTNQQTVFATRTYVLGWSCTTQAVLVNLT